MPASVSRRHAVLTSSSSLPIMSVMSGVEDAQRLLEIGRYVLETNAPVSRPIERAAQGEMPFQRGQASSLRGEDGEKRIDDVRRVAEPSEEVQLFTHRSDCAQVAAGREPGASVGCGGGLD